MANDSIGNDNTMEPGKGNQHNQSLNPGDTLGQYKIIRLLGRGGMGEVYEVEHTVLHKNFAIKLLPSDFAKKREALKRLEREAEVMARLEHPNILTVDDFGETDGRYWLRMELIDTLTAEDENTGKRCDVGSLQQLADFCDGKIPEDVLLPIIEKILKGLSYAHEKGAIHRDLKPGNILLQSNTQNQDGSPIAKIADFGLVRVVGEEWMRSQAQMSVSHSMISVGEQPTEAPEGGTSTKALLGTYEYMSPEQRKGEEADQRSDIYSLGLMIYRLLTGEREATFDLPTDLNPHLSPVWDEIVKDSLQSRRGRRISDCDTILQKLETLKSSQQTEQKMTTPIVSDDESKVSSVPQADTTTADDQKNQSARGQNFAVPELDMKMVYVEPGTFYMGAEDFKDERPVHQVEINRGFWIGKYPVTQGEYEWLMGKKPSHFKSGKTLGLWGGEIQPAHPVEEVTWHAAVKFCKKLTESERNAGRLPEGYEYRLPTEAEWEYAARGGQKSKGYKYSGSDDIDKVAWYKRNSGRRTHEVGQKKSNELGIYDMSGNVWEWCLDYWHESYEGAPRDGSAWTSGGNARWHALRGGSWHINARLGRCAYRNYGGPEFSCDRIGFRVVLSFSR